MQQTDNDLWTAIAEAIRAHTGRAFHAQQRRALGGGCINQAWMIGDGQQHYFIKLNRASALAMFEAEADGLRELAASKTLRIPTPIACGTHQHQAWLAMEALDLSTRGSAAELGRRLAAMHRVEAKSHGWFRDNTIGSSPQYNQRHHDWPHFWEQQRLRPQLALALTRGAGQRLAEQMEALCQAMPALFSHYTPPPSLLHGDLWSGNYAYCDGEPTLFDPAIYYGDRETDLAMTELFGGFGADFYAAYHEAWPLDSGYAARKTLYQLYHVLNHYNLFGGGYLQQAEGMIQRLMSEIR